MAPLLNGASEPIEAALAGKPASFSWRVLTQGHPATPGDLRGVIEVRPVMDFKSVQPGLDCQRRPARHRRSGSARPIRPACA